MAASSLPTLRMQWTPSEDNQLVEAVLLETGTSREEWVADDRVAAIDWDRISSKYLPRRNKKQCRERWLCKLNPYIDCGPFRAEECIVILLKAYETRNSWQTVANCLERRTAIAVRNHHKTLSKLLEAHFPKVASLLDSESDVPPTEADLAPTIHAILARSSGGSHDNGGGARQLQPTHGSSSLGRPTSRRAASDGSSSGNDSDSQRRDPRLKRGRNDHGYAISSRAPVVRGRRPSTQESPNGAGSRAGSSSPGASSSEGNDDEPSHGARAKRPRRELKPSRRATDGGDESLLRRHTGDGEREPGMRTAAGAVPVTAPPSAGYTGDAAVVASAMMGLADHSATAAAGRGQPTGLGAMDGASRSRVVSLPAAPTGLPTQGPRSGYPSAPAPSSSSAVPLLPAGHRFGGYILAHSGAAPPQLPAAVGAGSQLARNSASHLQQQQQTELQQLQTMHQQQRQQLLHNHQMQLQALQWSQQQEQLAEIKQRHHDTDSLLVERYGLLPVPHPLVAAMQLQQQLLQQQKGGGGSAAPSSRAAFGLGAAPPAYHAADDQEARDAGLGCWPAPAAAVPLPAGVSVPRGYDAAAEGGLRGLAFPTAANTNTAAPAVFPGIHSAIGRQQQMWGISSSSHRDDDLPSMPTVFADHSESMCATVKDPPRHETSLGGLLPAAHPSDGGRIGSGGLAASMPQMHAQAMHLLPPEWLSQAPRAQSDAAAPGARIAALGSAAESGLGPAVGSF